MHKKGALIISILLLFGITVLAVGYETRENIVKTAQKHLGERYELGSAWPPYFDCSGLVNYVYSQAGFVATDFRNVGPNYHGPNAFVLAGMSDPIDDSEMLSGDLVFSHGTYDKNEDGIKNNNDQFTHVGIYIGNNKIIHAGDPIDVTTIEEWKTYGTSYAGARRIKSNYWPEEGAKEFKNVIEDLNKKVELSEETDEEKKFENIVDDIIKKTDTDDKKIYRNEELKIEFSYPKKWGEIKQEEVYPPENLFFFSQKLVISEEERPILVAGSEKETAPGGVGLTAFWGNTALLINNGHNSIEDLCRDIFTECDIRENSSGIKFIKIDSNNYLFLNPFSKNYRGVVISNEGEGELVAEPSGEFEAFEVLPTTLEPSPTNIENFEEDLEAVVDSLKFIE